MKCPVNDPLCTGPYTEDACDKCIDLEKDNKCLNNPPRKGKLNFRDKVTHDCSGPFADGKTKYRCSDCAQAGKAGKAAWEVLVTDRANKRAWRKTLKRTTVREIYVASECADITPADINEQYDEDLKNGVQRDWCPWVKIGNLYTTVTTGNDAGWRLLVQNHIQPNQGRGGQDISVFTGRHGNPEGTITQDGNVDLFHDGVMDGGHYLQDILQKVVTEGLFAARPEKDKPRIKLWDVGTTAGTTMTRTQQLAIERLRKNEIVIFAWCWSLLSFYKVSASEAAKLKKWDKQLAFNRPIKEIAEEKYGWAHVSGMKSVGTPGEIRWLQSEWRQAVGRDRKLVKQVVPSVFPNAVTPSYAEENKNTLVAKLETALRRPTHNH